MHQFTREELKEMFNESILEARQLAKLKGASIYYGVGDLWIREDAEGNKFIQIFKDHGDDEEVPYVE